MTVSEEIVHTDAKCDVQMFEKRYHSASKSICPNESVDIFVDLSLDESGISEMRIRQVEEDKIRDCDEIKDFVEINFNSFDRNGGFLT